MNQSRREFLLRVVESAAFSAAAAALPGCKREAPGGAPPADPAGALAWHKGVCRFCGTGCGVQVATQAGRVIGVQGDVHSPVNRGLLCIKGYSTPLILYGADRLTHPQIRARKGGPLLRASWEDALALVTGKLKDALQKNGPRGIGMYLSGQSTIPEGYAALKWMKGGLGSNNLEANARLCMASAVTGHMTTFGSDEPAGCYDDLDEADVFVLWGANMAEMHPVLFSRMTDRKARQPFVKLVDISVRRTRTTDQADLFLQIVPQGDLALANAIAHCLLRDGRIDTAFVEAHVHFKAGLTQIGYALADRSTFTEAPRPLTLAEFKDFLADYAPEKVAVLTGVPVAQIEELARLYGDPKTRVVTLWTMGVNQHTRGTWMNNLLHNLHLLTGKFGKPGCTSLSLTGQPSACGTAREVGLANNRLPADMVTTNPEHVQRAAALWQVPPERIPTAPGWDTIEMFRALDRGDVSWLWVQCTNPMQSLPNAARYRAAAQKEGRFLVVSDVYPTETTSLADVVLPSALWVEKEGYYGNTERRTQHWAKMVEPPGEARSDVWQILEVARRSGHGALFTLPAVKEHGHSVERALYEEYRQFTLGTGKDLASHDELLAARGLRWPVVKGRETRRRYVEGEDPYVKPGEGVKFYKNKKEEGRAVVWARPYEAPPEVPDAEYPFWLCTGRVLEHWHTGSLTRRVPQLHRAVPRSYVEVHPDDAAALGVTDGASLRLRSRRGSLVLTVSINGRSVPRKGLVFVPFFDERLLINLLTLDASCPISREPDYKKCAVWLERA